MSIKKKYLKKKPVCKVTFRMPKEAANSVESVHVVGDFNGWDTKSIPMKKLKSGDFTATVDLAPYKEYQFRYLLGEDNWENDRDADKYIATHFENTDNSVVVV